MLKASRSEDFMSTMRLAMPNTMRACEPVVAPEMTCGPFSPSQVSQ
jgi:hypothetical protein